MEGSIIDEESTFISLQQQTGDSTKGNETLGTFQQADCMDINEILAELQGNEKMENTSTNNMATTTSSIIYDVSHSR